MSARSGRIDALEDGESAYRILLHPMSLRRIAVIGCSGAGKSTFASKVAVALNLPVIEADPFFWEAGWKPAEPQIAAQRISDAVAGDEWVIDGIFGGTGDPVWSRADTVLWLDYPFSLILYRVCRRNLGLLISQKPFWSGNRMTAGYAWSGIHHAVRSYARKRRRYRAELPNLTRATVVRFARPADAERWLSSLRAAC